MVMTHRDALCALWELFNSCWRGNGCSSGELRDPRNDCVRCKGKNMFMACRLAFWVLYFCKMPPREVSISGWALCCEELLSKHHGRRSSISRAQQLRAFHGLRRSKVSITIESAVEHIVIRALVVRVAQWLLACLEEHPQSLAKWNDPH